MQYGGVATNDERKAAEALDAVRNPHWQLLVQVPGTFLEGKKGEKTGLGPEWLGQSSRHQMENEAGILPEDGFRPENGQNRASWSE